MYRASVCVYVTGPREEAREFEMYGGEGGETFLRSAEANLWNRKSKKFIRS